MNFLPLNLQSEFVLIIPLPVLIVTLVVLLGQVIETSSSLDTEYNHPIVDLIIRGRFSGPLKCRSQTSSPTPRKRLSTQDGASSRPTRSALVRTESGKLGTAAARAVLERQRHGHRSSDHSSSHTYR